jgi:putative phosphoesterase
MSTRLLVLADTHIPGRARALPAAVLRAADEADLLVHAGDWVTEGVLDELEQHGEVLGVWGNNDGTDLRARLPEVARRRIEALELAVVHETGDARSRERRMDLTYPDADVLIFGHSHIPWDTTTPKGLRLLNPGSPTDRRRQPHHTYLTLVVDGDALRDVDLVAL